MKPPTISRFVYKEQEFDVLLKPNNELSYIFEVGNDRYGRAVKIDGNRKLDVVNAACALLLNLMETYDAVTKK